MGQDDNKKKLDEITRRRDAVQAKAERAKGRLDAATRELDGVVEECRKKGLDPEQLPEAIAKLQGKFDALAADLTRRVEEAERAIEPYLEETK